MYVVYLYCYVIPTPYMGTTITVYNQIYIYIYIGLENIRMLLYTTSDYYGIIRGKGGYSYSVFYFENLYKPKN